MYKKFSIIIPCFNEARNIPALLSQLQTVSDKNLYQFILVDNGSTDSTSTLLSKIDHPDICTVKLSKNAGYGGGIKAGIEKARGDYIGWIHADLQYSLVESLKITQNLTPDIKFLKGKRRGRNLFQLFISANMSVFESILFRTPLYDINAQPTIFHKDLINFMKNIPNDFSIDLYTYVIARQSEFKISRFQVNFVKRQFGQSSWNSGLGSILRMSARTIKYSLNLRRQL